LTEGAVGPALLRFALPFLASNLLQSLYGAADLFVVGRFSGPAAQSAVAIGSQTMMTITAVILGISMGGTVLIGRRVGERSQEGAARAVGSLACLFALLALALTPAALFCVRPSIGWMNTPAEAVDETARYLFTCSCGIPFIVGYNAVSGIFRGMGDSRTPVLFVLMACVLNVGGDLLLTGWLGLGALGAAIATITAQGLSFLCALLFMVRRGFAFPFHRRHLRPDAASVLQILKVGLPLAVQDVLVHLSFLIITAIINTMGLIASAAVGVVEKIISFAMLPPSAFGSAVAAMSAQNLGAGRPDRARSALWHGVAFSLVFGVAVCLYSQVWPQSLTALFSKDADVIAAAGEYLRSYTLDCVLVSFVFCMNGYLSGCGKSVVSFIHSMLATFCVRVPVTWFMGRVANGWLYPMGLAAPAASVLSILVCAGYLLWQRRRGAVPAAK